MSLNKNYIKNGDNMMGKLLNWKLKKSNENGELLHMTYKDRDMLIEAINRLVDAVSELEDKLDKSNTEISKLKIKLINEKFNESL